MSEFSPEIEYLQARARSARETANICFSGALMSIAGSIAVGSALSDELGNIWPPQTTLEWAQFGLSVAGLVIGSLNAYHFFGDRAQAREFESAANRAIAITHDPVPYPETPQV